jgi:hypothetical protein
VNWSWYHKIGAGVIGFILFWGFFLFIGFAAEQGQRVEKHRVELLLKKDWKR